MEYELWKLHLDTYKHMFKLRQRNIIVPCFFFAIFSNNLAFGKISQRIFKQSNCATEKTIDYLKHFDPNQGSLICGVIDGHSESFKAVD